MKVGLHELPVPLAERTLRIVGARVRKEVLSASEQIEASREILAMPDAYGLLVFVSPPDRIGHQSVAWLINDIVRQSADRRKLDGALIIETALGLDDKAGKKNSFSSLWTISDKPLPDGFAQRIGKVWERETQQPARSTKVEGFTHLGSAH